MLSRRAFLQNSTLCLAGLGGGNVLAAESGAKPLLRIGLMTDLHYADKPPTKTRFYREALAKLDLTRLSPLTRQALQDRASLLRKEVGASVLERGKTAFRRNEWAETIEQLTRFLAMSPEDDEAIEASFFLGNALFQSRKYEDAIKPLTRFADGDKKARMRDFALLMLMQSHDTVGNKEKAIEYAKEGWQTYPASEFRTQFISRLQRATTTPAAASAAAGTDAGR